MIEVPFWTDEKGRCSTIVRFHDFNTATILTLNPHRFKDRPIVFMFRMEMVFAEPLGWRTNYEQSNIHIGLFDTTLTYTDTCSTYRFVDRQICQTLKSSGEVHLPARYLAEWDYLIRKHSDELRGSYHATLSRHETHAGYLDRSTVEKRLRQVSIKLGELGIEREEEAPWLASYLCNALATKKSTVKFEFKRI